MDKVASLWQYMLIKKTCGITMISTSKEATVRS
jgi:hypothetical protein